MKKGLVNGRRANMVSMTWNETDKRHKTIKKLYKGELKGGVEYSVPFPESVNVEIYKKDKKGKIIDRKIVPIPSVSSSLKIPETLRNHWNLPKTLNVVMIYVDLGFAYQRLTHVHPVGSDAIIQQKTFCITRDVCHNHSVLICMISASQCRLTDS